MRLHCPQCGELIHAADIHLANELAKCRGCHAVFSFAQAADQDDEARAVASGQRERRRPEAPLPKGIVVDDTGMGLRFVRRWFSPEFIFLIFFCAVWDGFLIFWYAMGSGFFGGQGGPDGPMSLCFFLFPIGHVAVGVFLTYFTICGLLNRTVIDVEQGQLRIRHTPLPWPGSKSLDTHSLDQLYCQRKVSHGRHGNQSETYELHAVDKEGRKVSLLKGLEDADQALYLEQEIERHLGIRDRPVRGEI